MEPPSLAKREARMLQSRNAIQTTEYIRLKYDLLMKQNAFDRGETLTYLGNRHAFVERLDKDVLNASLIAERQTYHFREPAWSIELAEARKKVTLLSKTLSAIRTGLNVKTILEADMSRMNTQFELPTTRKLCSKAIREAKQRVKEIVNDSYERRDEERKRRISELEKSTSKVDRAIAKRLRHLKKAEEIRSLFRKLKSLQQSDDVRRGITRLEIPVHPDEDPKSCTEWQEIDVPELILTNLIKRNQQHFGQAHGNPFTMPPLSTKLGFSGVTEAGEDILNGDFDCSDLDPNVQLFIRHLQQVDEMQQDPSRPTISEEDYVSKLKVWSENTTTSPSGLHLGHYKALIGRHTHSTDVPSDKLTPEFLAIKEELDYKQSALRQLHLQLLNYGLERGYAYTRWKTVANTILFKDSDNYQIHRTRVIHLYEADYNLALGLKWRVAMQQAEDFRCLNAGQYGSRAHHNAVDPVMVEELQYEISRASRSSVAVISYDAMACYDRIIPVVAMLASRKYGVPLSVTLMIANMLKDATYRLKMETGLASQGYSHDENFPIYGTGQGSGNSPAIWCFISSTLFDCYDELANKAFYFDPTKNLEIELGMTGYVDDCGGQTNEWSKDPKENTERLIAKVTHDAQCWTNLLSVSGGTLSLPKCSGHLMQWQYTIAGAPVLVVPNSQTPIKVEVTDPITKKIHQLDMLSPFKAHKTLGHYKEPAGTQATQCRELQRKSDKITVFLWKHSISRVEAWTYYYASYLPAVTYPLAASTMTEKQLEDVQRKALSIIVARCGYNRNTKREILFGPASLGGANFRHLYVEQGIGQINMFIRQWRRRSTVGTLFRIALSWFQLATGVSYPILEKPSKDLPHLESKWIASLRAFLSRTNASIRIDSRDIQTLQRENDEYIMDRILDSKTFDAEEIKRLNYCRLYLQAVTISDLTVIDGDQLDPGKWIGQPTELSSLSRLEWPRQNRPSPATWSLWKKANNLWSNGNGVLYQPLGGWIVSSQDQRQSHHAYRDEDKLYIRNGDKYQVCNHFHQHRYEEVSSIVDWYTIPHSAIPVNVQHEDTFTWTVESPPIAPTPVPEPIVGMRSQDTFASYIKTIEPWEEQLLQNVELFTDPGTIVYNLEHGLRAVSDGSVITSDQGTFGWTLSTDLGERAAVGKGPVSGSRIYPYRAEATGMLSLLRFLHRLALYTGKHDHWIGTIATDSESLLKTLAKWSPQVYLVADSSEQSYYSSPYNEVLIPEWDVLVEIYHSLQSMPYLRLEYVKAHQDREHSYNQLPLMAQLNVDADRLAKSYQREHGKKHPVVMMLPHTRVLLDVPEGTVTAHIPECMRFQANGKPLVKYMQTRNKWSDFTVQLINWKAHEGALRKQIKRKTHMTKLVHDIVPTNYQVHRDVKHKQRCSECNHVKEDRDHVLRCTAASRVAIKSEALEKLRVGCQQQQTDPELQHLLLTAVQGWMNEAPEMIYRPNVYEFPTRLSVLIQQQSQIGWRHIFNGRFSGRWAEIQEEHYSRMDQSIRTKQMTGQNWQINIIGEIWEAWFLIWEKRNQDVHGHDSNTRTQATKKKVEDDLREIYAVRHKLEPRVREFLEDDVETHRRRPTWVNQNWLAVHQPLVRDSLRKFKTGVLQGVRSIRDYMKPTI